MGFKGYYMSKTKIIFCALAFAAVTVLIGLLCGLLPTCTSPSPIQGTQVPNEPPATTQQKPKEIWEELRLPTSLKPHHYDLYLRTDITNKMFNGSVDILISCEEATNYIILHSKMLDIFKGSATLRRVGNVDVLDLKEPWLYEENQYMVVELSTQLLAGEMYVFSVEFGAELKNSPRNGHYLSSYTRGNEKRYLATTHFEPLNARKAFPCFDEPAMKANFTMTMDYEPQYNALANMPDESNEVLDDGWKRTKFAMSVPMSTYLVCYVVSDFVQKSGTTKNGVVMRLWAREDFIDNVDYALEKGIEQLDFYDEYFATKFPLPKMDMIAIPGKSGAMENWGLITYGEMWLLYEEGVSSASDKQGVCGMIAHELAHQWFGNLVTMKWWDDIWLNEGFASYFTYLGVGYSEPDWGMLDQFVAKDLQGVLVKDSLATSRPISIPVLTPAEIIYQFDIISYRKGASIIRMLSFVLGESTFQKGLKNYLEFFKYGNTVNDDLWEILRQAALNDGMVIDVKQIMDTWTLQMGYPSVRVNRQYAVDAGFTANQTRFLIEPETDSTTEYDDLGYQWYVPVTYITALDSDPGTGGLQWINPNEELNVAIPSLNNNDWLLVNYDERGYYRVNYDAANWDLLKQQLISDHTAITIASRSALLSDAFNLARAGALNYSVALDQTLYLIDEKEYVPWRTVSSVTKYINLMISRSAAFGSFKKYMRQQVTPLYEYVGWSDTGSHLDRRVRSIAISLACGNGNEKCTATAINMFQEWMDNPANNTILPDIRYTVYCTAIAAGEQDEWFFALDQYQTTSSSTEQSNLRRAMACSNEPWILSIYLEYTENPDLIRSQDVSDIIISVASNNVGAPLAWDYLRAKYDYLRETISLGWLDWLKESITSHFNTEFQLQELKDFMAENPDQGSASRTSIQIVEATQANIRWMENHYDDVEKWLQDAVSF